MNYYELLQVTQTTYRGLENYRENITIKMGLLMTTKILQ